MISIGPIEFLPSFTGFGQVVRGFGTLRWVSTAFYRVFKGFFFIVNQLSAKWDRI